MGKTKVSFLYKVRGGFSPNGLQKVFFSYHPSDRIEMEKLSDDLLELFNCSIFYHADALSTEEIDLADLGIKLKEMTLFVMVVTTNYLMCDNLAKNWEFGFAVNNHIPILPITTESGLEELFETEMNRIKKGYGDIQLLNSKSSNSNEIPYRQKLVRFLNAVLIDKEKENRIKQAFTGRIFLSYRKRDRRLANELMRTIHNIPLLQNVSIWYDEYITAGEKWTCQIEDALGSCDVFLLLITPHITEPDNYVLKKEYPAAIKQGKQIVSAKKDDKNDDFPCISEIRKIFPELKILVDGEDATALKEALQGLAAVDEADSEKNYLIGLAYFAGIDIERDSQRAASLIVAAAQNGLPEAINKVADMYWTGEGVAVNYDHSIQWRKKLVELSVKEFERTQKCADALSYCSALSNLVSCLYELSANRESLMYSKQLLSFLDQVSAQFSFSGLQHLRMQAYDFCGKNCLRLADAVAAIAYFKEYCRLAKEEYEVNTTMINLHNVAVAYERIGDSYYAVGNMSDGEKRYNDALKINAEIDRQLQTVDSAYSFSSSSIALGDIHIRCGDYSKADRCYAQAVELRNRILGADNSIKRQKEYAEALLARGTSLLFLSKTKQARKLFFEGKDILESIASNCATIENQHAYSVALNRCAKVCEIQHDFRLALLYFSESLSCRKQILSHIITPASVFDYALTLFYIANIYEKLYNTNNARESYEEVLDSLRPILSKDVRGDWHRIFAISAFELFRMDTFAGKQFLQYAIDSWKWMKDMYPRDPYFQEQYENCLKIYVRCYRKETDEE